MVNILNPLFKNWELVLNLTAGFSVKISFPFSPTSSRLLI